MRNSQRPVRYEDRARLKKIKPNNGVSRLESLKAFIREGEQAEIVAPVLDRWLDDLETKLLMSVATDNTMLEEYLKVIYKTGLELRHHVETEIDIKGKKSLAYERNTKEE